jgi:hypothetical protein
LIEPEVVMHFRSVLTKTPAPSDVNGLSALSCDLSDSLIAFVRPTLHLSSKRHRFIFAMHLNYYSDLVYKHVVSFVVVIQVIISI